MVSNSWGMTEAGPAFCIMPPDQVEKRVGSVGMPVPPVQFRIVDADGNDLPAGTVGELLVTTPVVSGVLQRPRCHRPHLAGRLAAGDLLSRRYGFLYRAAARRT